MRNVAVKIAIILALFAFASQVAAQMPQPGGQTATPPGPRATPRSESPSMSVPRASEIIGLSVVNPQNEDLGKVNDLILGNDGRISYMVVGRGGLMGVGEKLCAIPWQAAHAEVRERAVVVSLSKQQLDGAPVFEDWNQFSSGEYKTKVQAYYGAEAEGQTTTSK